MAHESFEDSEVADILNSNFISIKVDREERPDVDSIYMSFCQAFRGSGGWPLTIIMTPDAKPFFADTYMPKKRKYNMTGLVELLTEIVEQWNTDRGRLLRYSEMALSEVGKHMDISAGKGIAPDIIERTIEELKDNYERDYGGFNRAPKFPTPHNLLFLMRAWKATGDDQLLKMVEHTLDCMYKGGIFDHVGFGFSRYSTDEKWLVPHFEKMLYDNALLAMAYAEAYSLTKRDLYRHVADKIFLYVERELTSEEGGFYCGEDADSEGVEGKYYVWTPQEIIKILGEDNGKLFCNRYGITETGNFEGKNIPNLIGKEIELSSDMEGRMSMFRALMFAERSLRIHPHKDDKMLASWNGLMIAAMAYGGRILNNSQYVSQAQKAARFILDNMTDEQGSLYCRYREGHVANKGFLEDHAFFIWGLIELYETTCNNEYLEQAVKLNQHVIRNFWDNEKGGFYMYGEDAEQLLLRPKETYDGAMPSGNSIAVFNILRLAELTSDRELLHYAEKCFDLFGELVGQAPLGYTMFLLAYLHYSDEKNK